MAVGLISTSTAAIEAGKQKLDPAAQDQCRSILRVNVQSLLQQLPRIILMSGQQRLADFGIEFPRPCGCHDPRERQLRPLIALGENRNSTAGS